MSYFKKFTDLLAGIATFITSVFLISRYMEYTPPNPEDVIDEGLEVKSKLENFLFVQMSTEYRQYIILIALLVLSLVVSRFLKKYPAVSFCISALPLCQVMNMFRNQLIYEYGGLILVLCVLHVVGTFYDAVYLDKTDNKKRTFVAVTLWGVISGAACFVARKLCFFADDYRAQYLAGELLEDETKLDRTLKVFGFRVLTAGPDDEEKVIMTIMVLLLVSVVVSVILRGVYFIDVIAAAIPFVYGIYCWHARKLVCAPMLVLIPLAIYFFARVGLFITGAGIKTRE